MAHRKVREVTPRLAALLLAGTALVWGACSRPEAVPEPTASVRQAVEVEASAARAAFAFSNTEKVLWEDKGGTNPGNLYWHALVYHAARGKTLLLGGQFPDGSPNSVVWGWNGSSWTDNGYLSPNFYRVMAVYDSTRQVAVAFSRSWGYYTQCCFSMGLTELGSSGDWSYRCDGSTQCANGVNNDTGAAAFFASRGRTVLFDYDGTHEWTGSSYLKPAVTEIPLNLDGFMMTYDSSRKLVVLFGGKNGSNYSDTYEYDGFNWVKRNVSGPSARSDGTLTYDPYRKRVILFGGMGSGGALSDLWEYDGNEWKSFGNAPFGARAQHAVAFDSVRRRMVLYGGGTNGSSGVAGTWEYSTYGGSCSSSSDCDTGNCVDGVCCKVSSCSACQTCNGSSPGECTPVKNTTDDSCNGAKSCDGAANCKLINGQGCGAGSDCVTTNCIDGVCCDGACGGACDACNVTGKVGTCSNVAAGSDGTPSCAPYACSGTSGACGNSCKVSADCAKSAYCSGGKCVADKADGAACTAGDECKSGNCVDGVCCNGPCAGNCAVCLKSQGASADGVCTNLPANAEGSPSCAPYLCAVGGVCANACVTAANCAPGSQCVGSKCIGKKGLGGSCSDAGECTSGYCVDGVCCNDSCTGACQACSAAAKQSATLDGVCDVAKLGSNPGKRCLDSGSASCDTDGTCDAQGHCAMYAAGTSCGAAICGGNAVTGYQSSSSSCDGAGACVEQQVPCLGFACNATADACLDSCFSAAECDGNSYCEGGSCVQRKFDGVDCTEGSECQSNRCVDGVCCNAPCNGQCEACDLVGAVGKCTPVVGSPHGDRPACDPGDSGEPCAARECDGNARGECVGYVGPTVTCREPSCEDGVAQLAGSCDSKGSCKNDEIVQCTPFVCDGNACGEGPCENDADCAAEFRCEDGDCIARDTTKCDDDGVTQINPDGSRESCLPFACSGIACLEACATSEDCGSAFVCDASSRTCVGNGPSGDDGGCAVASVAPPSRPAWLALVAVVLVVAGMRRRTGRGGVGVGLG